MNASLDWKIWYNLLKCLVLCILGRSVKCIAKIEYFTKWNHNIDFTHNRVSNGSRVSDGCYGWESLLVVGRKVVQAFMENDLFFSFILSTSKVVGFHEQLLSKICRMFPSGSNSGNPLSWGVKASEDLVSPFCVWSTFTSYLINGRPGL